MVLSGYMRRFALAVREALGLRDQTSAIVFCLSALIAMGNLGIVAAFLIPRWGKLSFIRLHYSASLGVDWEGEWWKIFIFPAVGLGFLLLNMLAASILSKRQQAYATVLLFCTVGIELAAAAGAVAAVLLNS